MTELEAAAVAWWESKRPLVYSLAEHLENPRINLTTAREYRLAEAVAALLKQDPLPQEIDEAIRLSEKEMR